MVRLKIYLVPDQQTVQFCRTVNAQLRRISDSAIVFSSNSPMIPHITLVMGELLPSQTLQALTNDLRRLAQSVKPFTLELSQPFIEPQLGQYILCAVRENPLLTEFRKRMRECILGSYLTTRHVQSSEPHLTLAHIAARHDRIEEFLQRVTVIPQMVCTRIEISRVGVKGSCIDRIGAFTLLDSEEEYNRYQ